MSAGDIAALITAAGAAVAAVVAAWHCRGAKASVQQHVQPHVTTSRPSQQSPPDRG